MDKMILFHIQQTVKHRSVSLIGAPWKVHRLQAGGLQLSLCFSRCLVSCSSVLSSNSPHTDTIERARFSSPTISLLDRIYDVDSSTNITPRIVSKMGRCLHCHSGHPVFHVWHRIENYFSSTFVSRVGHPRFVMFDNLNPVVTVHQNFDSLLVPSDHPSRSFADTYYVNSGHLLRSHMTAHDEELIQAGFDAFLLVGDVYRRDEIDVSHYPVFHQVDGVCLFTEKELFSDLKDAGGLALFESGKRTVDKQEMHTIDAAKLLELRLKQTLLGLVHKLFGTDIRYRWVECYFPFTHPSWELEIYHNGDWFEVLGSGLLEQKVLQNAGVNNKVGWAFGLGLDRLVMTQYQIPDIRLLWSEDERFLDQFAFDNPDTPVTFKPFSKYLPRKNDISFWLPETGYSPNDFYDLVRSIGGDTVLKVTLNDVYATETSPPRTSHCYTITYQLPDGPITQADVAIIHSRISAAATELLGVQVR